MAAGEEGLLKTLAAYPLLLPLLSVSKTLFVELPRASGRAKP